MKTLRLGRTSALHAVLLAFTWPLVGMAQEASGCGSLANHYGPFDYRQEKDGRLRIVERSHFTPQVEALVRGVSGPLHAELNYVLRTAPNHHRALLATMRLAARMKTPWVRGMDYSVECWLERAVRFAPNDTVARAMYAQYLGTLNEKALGIEILDQGLSFTEDNPLSTYNFGLVYLELGDADKALRQAHRAMELGDPRQQLADMLRQAGKWRDPP
jgi:hypothetical protein